MTEVVNPALPTTEPEVEVVPPVETPASVPAPQPGDKTDPVLLLKSLKEEREKRQTAEKELSDLKRAQAATDVYSDEGKLLLGKISDLEADLSARNQKELLTNVQQQFPVLQEKSAEFQEFLDNPENAGMQLATAAKAFLIENDLLTAPKTRKGLEPAGGGGRTPSTPAWTPEKIEELRVSNYRQYANMIRKGGFNQ